MNRTFVVISTLLLALTAALGREGSSRADLVAAKTIGAEALTKHVAKLASDEFEGRGAGSPGDEKAVTWLEEQFREIGLAPKGENGFRQPFKGPKDRKLMNLIGYLEGTDEKLKRETIVISAHHDHLGKRGEKVYYGADDNASGCASVLEIARALKAAGGAKRSYLFILFDGEEIGLRGSRYFIANPTVEKSGIVANLNLDMVSRGALDHVCLSGPKEWPNLKAVADRFAPDVELALDTTHDTEWRNQSDHGPFADAKIPYLYLGVEDHEDYHKPTDTADKVVKEKLEKIARLTYLIAYDLGVNGLAPATNGEKAASDSGKKDDKGKKGKN